MKKVICLMLTAAMCVGMSACSQEDDIVEDPYKGNNAPVETPVESEQNGSTEVSTEEKTPDGGDEAKQAMIKDLYDNMLEYGTREVVTVDGTEIDIWTPNGCTKEDKGSNQWVVSTEGFEATYEVIELGDSELYSFVNTKKNEYLSEYSTGFTGEISASNTYEGLNSNFFFITMYEEPIIKEVLYGGRVVDDKVLVTKCIIEYTEEEGASVVEGTMTDKFLAVDLVMDAAFKISEHQIMMAETEQIVSSSQVGSSTETPTEGETQAEAEVPVEGETSTEGEPQISIEGVVVSPDGSVPSEITGEGSTETEAPVEGSTEVKASVE